LKAHIRDYKKLRYNCVLKVSANYPSRRLDLRKIKREWILWARSTDAQSHPPQSKPEVESRVLRRSHNDERQNPLRPNERGGAAKRQNPKPGRGGHGSEKHRACAEAS